MTFAQVEHKQTCRPDVASLEPSKNWTAPAPVPPPSTRIGGMSGEISAHSEWKAMKYRNLQSMDTEYRTKVWTSHVRLCKLSKIVFSAWISNDLLDMSTVSFAETPASLGFERQITQSPPPRPAWNDSKSVQTAFNSVLKTPTKAENGHSKLHNLCTESIKIMNTLGSQDILTTLFCLVNVPLRKLSQTVAFIFIGLGAPEICQMKSFCKKIGNLEDPILIKKWHLHAARNPISEDGKLLSTSCAQW